MAPRRRPSPLARGETVLKPIHVNRGIQAAYNRKLQDALGTSYRELQTLLKRHYPRAGEAMAHDARDPVVLLQRAIRLWSKRLIRRFESMSDEVAKMFADRTQRDLDRRFRKMLRDEGFTVRWQMTKRMKNTLRIIVGENVALIKSIPQTFAKDIEGAVMRAMLKGGDLHALSKELAKRYGVTSGRASFIATDQAAKAKAAIEVTRQVEVGVEEAIWHHSGIHEQARPTHEAMNGKRFNIRRGMYDPDPRVRAYVWPGTEMNCRCISTPILPGMDVSGYAPPDKHEWWMKPGKVNVGAAVLKSKFGR